MKSIMRAVSTVVMVAAIALAVALVGVRLIGYDVYTVLSGSMEPTYHTGSVIYVKDCEPEEVQVGDPITFVMNEDLVVATHRVIEVDEEKGAFYTKGDANAAPDGSPVLFENLIGKPVFTIPYLGYVADYVQNPPGTYIAVAACAFLIMLTFLPDLFAKEEDEEEEPAKKRTRKGREARGVRPEPKPQDAYTPAFDAHQPARSSRVQQQGHGRQQHLAQSHQARAGYGQQLREGVKSAPVQRQPGVSARSAKGTADQAAAAKSNNPRLRLQDQQQRAARTAMRAQAEFGDCPQRSTGEAPRARPQR